MTATSTPGTPSTRWWLPPLLLTLGAAGLAWLCSGPLREPGTPGFWLLGYLVPLGLLVRAWFLPRDPAHDTRRVHLGMWACVAAGAYVPLIHGLGWTVLLVMLLTGNFPS